MTFQLRNLTLCKPGGDHIEAEVQFNGAGPWRLLKLTRSALRDAAPDTTDIDDVKDAIMGRCRSAVLEANAVTPAQISAAVTGKTFSI